MSRMDEAAPPDSGAQPEQGRNADGPETADAALSQDETAGTPPSRPRRQLLPFLPRNVKITLMVLLLFFLGEYVLLPELASAAARSSTS